MNFPISYPVGEAWYALAIYSRSEFRAEREIRDKIGWDAYTPRLRERKIIRRRRIDTASPLFPGYGFARFDIQRDDWGKLLEVEGVIDILSNQQVPVRIPDRIIDSLKRAEDAGAFDMTKPSAAFSVGDTVEIKDGPFAGLIAKIKSASKKKRVDVVLNFLGRLSVFSFDTCDLARV